MNKFKKVMLGALSVLTLGLFAVVGIKVTAEVVVNSSTSGKYFDYTISSQTATWSTKSGQSNSTLGALSQSEMFGMVAINGSQIKYQGTYVDVRKYENSTYTGLYLPVPSGSSGTINLTTQSGNGGKRTLAIYNDGVVATSSGKVVTQAEKTDDVSLTFDSTDIYTTNGNSYIGFVQTTTGGSYKYTDVSVTLGTGQAYIYTLSFDANGGSCSTTNMNVLANGKPSSLPTPEKADAVFDGWYTSADGGNRVTSSTSITSSQTLYAHWISGSVQLYDVTFMDGTTTVSSQEVAEGSYASAPADPGNAEYGYSFTGWAEVVDGSVVDVNSIQITSDKTFYAIYSMWSVSSKYDLTSSQLQEGQNYFGKDTEITVETSVPGTIYTFMPHFRMQTTSSKFCVGTMAAVTTGGYAVKVSPDKKGVLVVSMTSAGGSARSSKMIDSNGTEISAISGNTSWTETEAKNYEIRTLQYKLDENKDYYLGGTNGMRILSAEFIPESVTPLVQKATDSTYTYVRFVTIIKGVEEIDATDVSFSITMTYSDNSSKTVNYTPYVVKKITQNNETYTATVGSATHTFDNSVNPTEYYVVYVLRLTTSKFSGNSVKATTTFGGTSYVSDSETI